MTSLFAAVAPITRARSAVRHLRVSARGAHQREREDTGEDAPHDFLASSDNVSQNKNEVLEMQLMQLSWYWSRGPPRRAAVRASTRSAVAAVSVHGAARCSRAALEAFERRA